MGTSPVDWPTTPWSLTAPESYTLLSWPGGESSQAFKLGLAELTTRGVLQIDTLDAARGAPRAVLRPGPRPRVPTEPPLASLWLLFTSSPITTFANGVQGVALPAFIRAAQRRFGNSLHRYRQGDVVPALVDRGLLAHQVSRFLWIFTTSRLVLTPAGQAARDDLDGRLLLARRQFGGWVDRDPARAVAYLALAGASVLLLDSLFPEMRRLQQHAADVSAATWSTSTWSTPTDLDEADDRAAVVPVAGESAARQEEAPAGDDASLSGPTIGALNMSGLDLGSLDLGRLAVDFDLGAFTSLDSIFSAVDAGVESATSGSGGDTSGASGGTGGDSGGSSDGGWTGGDSGGSSESGGSSDSGGSSNSGGGGDSGGGSSGE